MDALGSTASVAQLVGTVGRLISKIIDAARTARQNKRECEYLTARLSIIGEVLPRLPQDTKVKRSLTELVKTLGEAHDLVLACKNWSTARHLIGARRLADSLKEVNARIDSHVVLLNLVFTTSGSGCGDQTLPPNNTATGCSSGRAAPVRLTWAEIAGATNYFADELSRRSSEVLYKGRLRDGPEVAVKVLSKNGRHDDVEGAVVAEVEILSPLRHPHIVPLVGWCSEEEDRILVYHHEHMSNGTLRDHLLRLRRRVRVRARLRGGSTFSSSPVRSAWKARVEVLLGASRAIEHLHRCGVIHRNVTSFNILLDGSWAPRLSGFGQAILLAAAGAQVLVTEVVGTHGYVDPEYRRDGRVSAASDVYSFGVVMMETLTGEDPATMQMDSVLLAIRNRKLMDVLVRLPAATPRQLEALELVAHTAECCLFPHGNDRPAMPDVVANLERALTIINTKLLCPQ
ncbi:putative serine/threonine-protein kinase-like protein CCR3 [Hordeum vulgare]|uniref:Protein kinase domain-containing protein n=1 Tax=Hordeum vulgare subsp. vulgare TaxID=112509 RepID=A0A8I6XN40_HORVV|nr:probable serine/threonine-protein kinase PBL28 [Hordeum vulgare subsp. vulgare]KAE8780066.1 putative serine/threonine-protein kinase-like protein CCR3 [Hordeum vulgare]